MVGSVNYIDATLRDYISATLWDSLELYLNNTLVTPSGGHHTGYRSYRVRESWSRRDSSDVGVHRLSRPSSARRMEASGVSYCK